jgi:hypothetical protein
MVNFTSHCRIRVQQILCVFLLIHAYLILSEFAYSVAYLHIQSSLPGPGHMGGQMPLTCFTYKGGVGREGIKIVNIHHWLVIYVCIIVHVGRNECMYVCKHIRISISKDKFVNNYVWIRMWTCTDIYEEINFNINTYLYISYK